MPRHEPQRTCIVTRTVRAPHEMIRFVLDPEGRVVADLNEKLPGRGVWVTANREMVAQAVKRRAFSRGLKAEAKVSPTLPDEIDAALYRDLRQGFSLAKKAGAVVTGFAKVEADPGEEVEVDVDVAWRTLAHWDAGAHAFRVEPGQFTLAAGRSSRELRLDVALTAEPG